MAPRPWFLDLRLICRECWVSENGEEIIVYIDDSYGRFLKSEHEKIERQENDKRYDMVWVCITCIERHGYKTPSHPTTCSTPLDFYNEDNFSAVFK